MTNPTVPRLPPGTWNAHWFQVFNSISFTIVVGTPMVLFFKHHGASATMLGVLLALSPLLNILQIPAAKYVERFGCRPFMLKGWATRSFFIVGVAIVAWLPATMIGTAWRLGLVLVLMTAFNAARGISSCGYLPWMTQWIPENVRGRFLSRDQMATALAGSATMLATAYYMNATTAEHRFAVLFLASYVAAILSLGYLRRIPDVPVPATSKSTGRVPWKEMLLFPPFLKFMTYNCVAHLGFAGAGVLWVPLLRDVFGVSDSWILGMAAVSGAAVVLTLLVVGAVADRVGSRPLLGLAGLVFVVHFLSWAAVGARWLPMDWLTAGWVCVTAGIGFGLFGLANMRLAMATVPEMGRSHFFALFSVIINLTLGIAPVFWGRAVDALKGWHVAWGDWEWNRYSVPYLAVAVCLIAAQVLLRRVTEARTMTTDEFLYELMVKTPARGLSRLISRRPVP
jgi:MFS family permease